MGCIVKKQGSCFSKLIVVLILSFFFFFSFLTFLSFGGIIVIVKNLLPPAVNVVGWEGLLA